MGAMAKVMDAAAAIVSGGGGAGEPSSAAGARALLQSNSTGTMDISIGGTLYQELTMMWLLLCGCLVFFMQAGFALLEAGTIRIKNTRNILLKNVIDACVGAIAWWGVGNAFYQGQCGDNGFIGYYNFFSASVPYEYGLYWTNWFFSFAFCATASTVISGAMAERARFRAYLLYTSVVSAFIYPVVAHWLWSNAGWLSPKRTPNCNEPNFFEPLISGTMGTMDFAGSGVVHMVGGGAALMGAILLGPRLGRFSQDGHVIQFDSSSPSNMALGVFILWLGWYGFNSGSTGCFYECMGVAAQVAVNTTLSAAAGALTCLFLAVFNGNPGDIGPLLNGILAGAVSITAPCALVQSYAAVVIGCIGGAIYTFGSKLLLKWKIDDPVDAAPVHLFCGAWGVLSVGFFATQTSVEATYRYANDWGVFYGGSGKQLGMQILGVVCIAAWTCGLSGLLFWAMNKLGWLRVDKEVEQQGLDMSQAVGSGLRGNCFPCLPCCQD